jgi:transposase-like protein
MAFLPMRCPACQHTDVMKHGITAHGKPRDRCTPPRCPDHTLLVDYSHQGRGPAVKPHMLAMT